MKNIIKSFLILSSILFISNVGKAQLVSNEYCKNIENKVAMPLNPTHWYHNIVFENECSFNFSVATEETAIIFQVEKYKSKREAYKSFKSDFDNYCSSDIEETKATKLKKYNFWDKAYSCQSEGDKTVVGLWIKGKTFVSIFTTQKNLLIAEKSLRTISDLDN